MSIERLTKAASAAGFAMATPDDDAVIETSTEVDAVSEGRALVLAPPQHRFFRTETITTVSAWAKSVWPAWGGRQPA